MIPRENSSARQTDSLVLWRCGKTRNQPFCDGIHMQEIEPS
ncbi:MAG: hypothetical protein GYA42_03070 [Syntrophomonadaceae bacterium]|nr:hypothetical protein [Syntrophomonadaceae bacterium]